MRGDGNAANHASRTNSRRRSDQTRGKQSETRTKFGGAAKCIDRMFELTPKTP